MNLKKWTAALLAVFMVISLAACGPKEDENTGEGIVRVGNELITEADLQAYTDLYYYIQFQAEPDTMVEGLRDYIEAMCLEEMINVKALHQYYGDETDELVTDLVKEEVADFIEEARDADNEFLDKYKITDDTLEYIYTLDIYYQRIEKDILEELGDVDTLIAEYYEENKEDYIGDESVTGSHILVETEDEAKDIKAQLDAGGDFAELAKEHSLDGSAESGGILGTFGRGQMVEPFETAAFALEPGEISEPVESQFGWHIITISEKNAGGDYQPLEDVENDIKNILIRERFTEKIQEIRDELGVEYLDAKYDPNAEPDPEDEGDGNTDGDQNSDDDDNSDENGDGAGEGLDDDENDDSSDGDEE